MRFTDMDMQYLSGAKFSNGYHFRLYDNTFVSRLDCIINLVRGKRVLHIGCCDHIPLIEQKIKDKTWMHGLLLENCSYVAGIDINAEAVQYVQHISDKYNMYCADITEAMPEQLIDTKFDFAFLGEILEHTNNPVLFLNKLKVNLEKNVGKIIITVPNALHFRKMVDKLIKDNLSYEENINSDHRYWFTPYTIAKVCIEAGMTPNELLFCNPPYIISRIAKRLHIKNCSYHSIFSDTMVLLCSL